MVLIRPNRISQKLIWSINRNISRFSRMRIENQESKVIIHPNEGEHSATIILMHGLGDSGDGWLDSAQEIALKMPYAKFILPTAPRQPVTLNGGMRMNAWYDIKSLSSEDGATCVDGIASSITIIKEIINAEILLGIRNDRIVLSGFSQGGAMSLYCGLQLPLEMKPAGLLVMSGYLPGSSHFKLTSGFEDIPILHCHGTSDPVVQYRWGQMTQSHLTEKGIKSYEFKSYPGLGHTVTQDLLLYASSFLARVLPNSPELALAPKDPSEMSVKELKAAVRSAGLSTQAVGFTEKSEFVKLLKDYQNSKKNN